MNDDPWSVDYTGPHPEEPDQKSLDAYWERADEEDYWSLRYEEMERGEGSPRHAPAKGKLKWRHIWHDDGTWSITQEPEHVDNSKAKKYGNEINKGLQKRSARSFQDSKAHKNRNFINARNIQRDEVLKTGDINQEKKEENGEFFTF